MIKFIAILALFNYNSFKHPENKPFVFRFLKQIELTRTSYKVNEKFFNPTDSIAFAFNGSRKIENPYNVPPIVALHPVRAKLLGIKPGDLLEFIIPNGNIVKRFYSDVMSSAGKWDSKNWDRVDFLINQDEKDLSHKIILLR